MECQSSFHINKNMSTIHADQYFPTDSARCLEYLDKSFEYFRVTDLDQCVRHRGGTFTFQTNFDLLLRPGTSTSASLRQETLRGL